MSTNELNTLARDLKELRLMAEQLDAEIKTILYRENAGGFFLFKDKSHEQRLVFHSHSG